MSQPPSPLEMSYRKRQHQISALTSTHKTGWPMKMDSLPVDEVEHAELLQIARMSVLDIIGLR
eukprot:CAMPEP_0194514194 /NCGR_PEP_ID=MMETSP0253-20130528/46584_1 /TAXON_ID=2966 /ORGANISM="Noctiluca scintillans" /LENGTH=62 /DNA_ID=CAMNT_0039357823 /DNA_START=73 /DNA_END=261 /DNA_ORIENTATION=-